MTVRAKLSGALGLILGVLAISMLHQLGTIRESVRISHELAEAANRTALTTSAFLGLAAELEDAVEKYLVTRDEGYARSYHDAAAELSALIASMSVRIVGDTPESAEAQAELVDAWRHFRADTEPLLDGEPAAAPPASQPVVSPTELATVREATDQLRVAVVRRDAVARAAMAGQLAASESRARSVERLSWAAGLLALGVSLFVAVLVVRSISTGLARLKAGTRQVASGNFDHRLPVDGDDEFSDLASDFNVMTERLGELEQLKRDFLSKVSHDLKTPLASIQETNRALAEGVTGPPTEAQRRLLELSLECGERLAAMISDLLDLAALESGVLQLDPHDHPLDALLAAPMRLVGPLAERRGVRLQLLPAEGTATVRCDADRIGQVLTNLLSNAVKFSPMESVVEVGAEVRGDEVWISVADRGPGVPEEERAAIFERFTQTDAGRRVAGRGTGLGLSICRELAAAHGGRVELQGRPGGGSVFTLVIPRAAGALTPKDAAPLELLPQV